MARILNNQLLLGSVIALAIYWTLGIILPTPYTSMAVSFLLLAGGTFAAWRYVPPAFEIVILKRRVETVKDEADYYPVVGNAAVAFGAVYSGIFGLIWYYYGMPPEWSGTAYSSFGRAMMAAGFFFIWAGPTVPRAGIQVSNVAWLLVVISIAITAAFMAGIRVATPENGGVDFGFTRIHGKDYPTCPLDKPYWVSSSGKVHGLDSKFRSMVIPRKCFSTQADAMKAGYTSSDVAGAYQ